MSNSARFALPFLVPGQTEKEVVHNEALQAIELVVQPVVAGGPIADPPSAPSVGDMVVIGTPATGEFAGKEGNMALFTEGGWQYRTPSRGLAVMDRTDFNHWIFDGVSWVKGIINAERVRIAGMDVVGPQQPAIGEPQGGGTVDVEARAVLGNVLGALRSHGLIAT